MLQPVHMGQLKIHVTKLLDIKSLSDHWQSQTYLRQSITEPLKSWYRMTSHVWHLTFTIDQATWKAHDQCAHLKAWLTQRWLHRCPNTPSTHSLNLTSKILTCAHVVQANPNQHEKLPKPIEHTRTTTKDTLPAAVQPKQHKITPYKTSASSLQLKPRSVEHNEIRNATHKVRSH